MSYEFQLPGHSEGPDGKELPQFSGKLKTEALRAAKFKRTELEQLTEMKAQKHFFRESSFP